MANGGFGFLPRCAICGKLLRNGSDMHEALITRGDIRGREDLTKYIMVKENCVLVCPGGSGGSCHRKAETKEGRKICIKHLFNFVPFMDIVSFLKAMDDLMKGPTPHERLAEVQELHDKVADRVIKRGDQ